MSSFFLPSVALRILFSLAVLLNLTGLDLSHLITSSSWRNIKAITISGERGNSEVIIVSSKRVKSAKGHFIIAVKDSSYCSMQHIDWWLNRLHFHPSFLCKRKYKKHSKQIYVNDLMFFKPLWVL